MKRALFLAQFSVFNFTIFNFQFSELTKESHVFEQFESFLSQNKFVLLINHHYDLETQ